MTLSEWKEQSGHYVGDHKSGAKWIPANMPLPLHWELYHLTDYVVSSITGGSIWLVKRKEAS
jgi:hypothetical protein